GGQPRVAGAQLERGQRGTAGELVQRRIGEHAGHLTGVLGQQGHEREPVGVDALHHPTLRAMCPVQLASSSSNARMMPSESRTDTVADCCAWSGWTQNSGPASIVFTRLGTPIA